MRWMVLEALGMGALLACAAATGCEGPPERAHVGLPDLPAPRALAVDRAITSLALAGDHVYWTARACGQACPLGTLGRVRRDGGGAPELLASGLHNPTSLIVGERAVYWIDRGDMVTRSQIRALDREGTGEDEVRTTTPVGLGYDRFHLVAERQDWLHGTRLVVVAVTDYVGYPNQLVSVDPGDGTYDYLCPVPGGPIVASRLEEGAVTLVYRGDAGGFVWRAEFGAPTPAPDCTGWLVASTALPGAEEAPVGAAFDDRRVYWPAWRSSTRSTTLAATLLEAGGGPWELAELEVTIIGPPVVRGLDVWLPAAGTTGRDLLGAIGQVRTTDGQVTVHRTDYRPGLLAADERSELLVVTMPTDGEGSSQLLAQPLE